MKKRQLQVEVVAGEQAQTPEKAARELGSRLAKWPRPEPIEQDDSQPATEKRRVGRKRESR